MMSKFFFSSPYFTFPYSFPFCVVIYLLTFCRSQVPVLSCLPLALSALALIASNKLNKINE